MFLIEIFFKNFLSTQNRNKLMLNKKLNKKRDNMNLQNIFKVDAVITLINGIGLLFATSMFVEMANLNMSDSLLVFGQFMGVTFIWLAILTWRMPSIAGDSMNSFAQMWCLVHALWFLIIGFHIVSSQVGGATAYINIIITGIFAILYFMKSRDKEK